MKIADMRIQWMDGVTNQPVFCVLVENDTEPGKVVYEERNGVYRGEGGCLVHHFYYSRPGKGYGGRTFTIDLLDKKTGNIIKKDLIGPWNGGWAGVNAVFPDKDKATDVIVATDLTTWERGYTFCFAGISVEALLNFARSVDFVIPVEQRDPKSGQRLPCVKRKIVLGWIKIYGQEVFCVVSADGMSKLPDSAVILNTYS
jgi:hypothetical protein